MGSKGYIDRLKIALDSIDMEVLRKIAGAVKNADTVYVIGNGGSQANAAHLVLHLRDRGIKAFDVLADNAWVSATANDHHYDKVPSRLPISVHDVVFVISGSGESGNVLAILRRHAGIKLGLLGFEGGRAKAMCTLSLALPSREYGPIEDVHLACIHIINELLKEGA